MKTMLGFFAAIFLFGSSANAELLGDEWIPEKEMKRQSAFAREHNLLLVGLRCKFNEAVKTLEEKMFYSEQTSKSWIDQKPGGGLSKPMHHFGGQSNKQRLQVLLWPAKSILN